MAPSRHGAPQESWAMTIAPPPPDRDVPPAAIPIIRAALRLPAFSVPPPPAAMHAYAHHALVCPRRTHASRRHRSMLVACADTSSTSSTPAPEDMSTGDLFQISLLSGAAAGFAVDAILFPLDTLKTRLQLASSVASPAGISWLTGLYKGFGPAVIASAPAAAAFFGTYDLAKRVLGDMLPEEKRTKYAPGVHMVAAALGDVASSTVRSPFEVVKQRLQSGMYTSARTATSTILKKEGLAGFYTGYGSLVLRELPFDALQFPLYEWFKTEWKRAKKGQELRTWETCVCGSVAGGIAASVTTPLDVVKTRLMTQPVDNPKYLGLVHGLRTIAKEEGPRVLMSGVVPRVLWISLGGAIFFGAYEAAKKKITPIILQRSKVDQDSKKSL